MLDEPNAQAEPQRSQGGEWQLLLARLDGWLATVNPEQLWQQSQQPLRLLAALLALLIVTKIYGAVLETIASVPLMAGLLELVGVLWLVRYINRHLLRREDRQGTLATAEALWRRFRGQA